MQRTRTRSRSKSIRKLIKKNPLLIDSSNHLLIIVFEKNNFIVAKESFFKKIKNIDLFFKKNKGKWNPESRPDLKLHEMDFTSYSPHEKSINTLNYLVIEDKTQNLVFKTQNDSRSLSSVDSTFIFFFDVPTEKMPALKYKILFDLKFYGKNSTF